MSWPGFPLDTAAAAEYKRLIKIRLAIEFKLERIKRSRTPITDATADWIEKVLIKMNELTETLKKTLLKNARIP